MVRWERRAIFSFVGARLSAEARTNWGLVSLEPRFFEYSARTIPIPKRINFTLERIGNKQPEKYLPAPPKSPGLARFFARFGAPKPPFWRALNFADFATFKARCFIDNT